jgi:hypothetical protein
MNDIAQFSTLAALIIGGGAQGADKASNFPRKWVSVQKCLVERKLS